MTSKVEKRRAFLINVAFLAVVLGLVYIFFKYKDSVFEYNPENAEEMSTLSLKLEDTKGVLSRT